MDKKAGIGLGVGALLCIRLVLSFARSQHHSAPVEPYGYSNLSHDRAVDELLRGLPRDEQARVDEAMAEFRRNQESLVDRHCKSSKLTHLEPQGTTMAVFRSVRRAYAPNDVVIPMPWTVLGLPVLPTTSGVCVDADDAMVHQLADDEGPGATALEKLAAGAWLVQTPPGHDHPASTALVSQKFLAGLQVKGSLIAFAPVDEAVAFADSASPQGVRLAAKALGHVLAAEPQSIAFAEPLIFEQGRWHPWKPFAAPELAALSARVEVIHAASAIDLFEQARDVPDIGLLAHEPEVAPSVTAERSIDEKTRAPVALVSDVIGDAQAIARAPTVVIAGQTVTWETFARTAGDHLAPARVDGQVVPRVFVLESGFRWPAKNVARN